MKQLGWHVRRVATQPVWLTATLPPAFEEAFLQQNILTRPRLVRESPNRSNLRYRIDRYDGEQRSTWRGRTAQPYCTNTHVYQLGSRISSGKVDSPIHQFIHSFIMLPRQGVLAGLDTARLLCFLFVPPCCTLFDSFYSGEAAYTIEQQLLHSLHLHLTRGAGSGLLPPGMSYQSFPMGKQVSSHLGIITCSRTCEAGSFPSEKGESQPALRSPSVAPSRPDVSDVMLSSRDRLS